MLKTKNHLFFFMFSLFACKWPFKWRVFISISIEFNCN